MDALDTEKCHFDSILVVLCVTFGVFLECLGTFFGELFVCIAGCTGVVPSSIPLDFNRLQCNIINITVIIHNDVMLPSFRLS